MTRSESGRKGGLIGSIKRSTRSISNYNENPNYCMECGNIIPVGEATNACSVKKRKFCSHSCAASYNNKHFPKRKITRYCKKCGEAVQKKGVRYCDECKATKQDRIPFDDLKTDSSRKNRILEAHGYRCSMCGLTEWMGNVIPLILDHIDGDSANNSIANLRLVCGNCDMLLPTYKGKNKGNGRHKRMVRYKLNLSY